MRMHRIHSLGFCAAILGLAAIPSAGAESLRLDTQPVLRGDTIPQARPFHPSLTEETEPRQAGLMIGPLGLAQENGRLAARLNFGGVDASVRGMPDNFRIRLRWKF